MLKAITIGSSHFQSARYKPLKLCLNLQVWATIIGSHLAREPTASPVLTKCWNWELTLATNFGNHAQMVTKFGGQSLATKFGFVPNCSVGYTCCMVFCLLTWMIIAVFVFIRPVFFSNILTHWGPSTSDGPMIDYNRSSVGSLQILMIDYGNAIID